MISQSWRSHSQTRYFYMHITIEKCFLYIPDCKISRKKNTTIHIFSAHSAVFVCFPRLGMQFLTCFSTPQHFPKGIVMFSYLLYIQFIKQISTFKG